MASAIFRHGHRVRYSECTLGNHVYHARYLDFLDEARGEFFRSIGLPLGRLQEADTIFPIVEYRLHYRSPARYDDALTIEVAVAELKRVRLVFNHRVVNQDGALILEAVATYACTSLGGKPKRLPPELAEALTPWLAGPCLER
ncbi:MAG: acyl-CoA thioesterase [Limisphaerales bacterium]